MLEGIDDVGAEARLEGVVLVLLPAHGLGLRVEGVLGTDRGGVRERDAGAAEARVESCRPRTSIA